MSFSRIMVFITILGFLGFLYNGLYATPDEGGENNRMLTDFRLAEVTPPNKVHTEQDLKGQTTVLHFWASWCHVCLNEHDTWVQIKKKYPTLNIVGVVYRDDAIAVAKFLKEKQDPYLYTLNDAVGSLGLDLGIVGTPSTYVINEEGKIKYYHRGSLTLGEFERLIIPQLSVIAK